MYVLVLGSVSELYSVPLDGSLPPVLLSGPMVPGGGIADATVSAWPSFWIDPSGSWVVYRADQETDEVFEVFRVSIEGGEPLGISGPMVGGGDSSRVKFVPGSRRLVYSADQETDDHTELFMSNYGPRTAASKGSSTPR